LGEALYEPLLFFVFENAEAVCLNYDGIEDCRKLYFIVLSLDDNRLLYLYHFTPYTV
jgi:hypothetical protein